MTIEQQVCTLEQAKRLNELGVKQESWCYHYQNETPTNPNLHEYGCRQDEMIWRISVTGKLSILSTATVFEEYSAFTVAELGVMINGKENYLPYFTGTLWQRMTKKKLYTNITIHGKTEAQARAAMLIHLLENNIISVKNVNSKQ